MYSGDTWLLLKFINIYRSRSLEYANMLRGKTITKIRFHNETFKRLL